MKDIKNTNEKELLKTIAEKQVALRNFRFGMGGSKLKNVREGRGVRKEIARAMTEINSRKKAQ